VVGHGLLRGFWICVGNGFRHRAVLGYRSGAVDVLRVQTEYVQMAMGLGVGLSDDRVTGAAGRRRWQWSATGGSRYRFQSGSPDTP
jgi:hypothetical protein